MKLLCTTVFTLAITTASFADNWTVGIPGGGGGNFNTIQEAVDAASNGDNISVYPGTYTSTADEVVNMLGKQIYMHSAKGPTVTFIDGEGSRRGIVCEGQETSKTFIIGFTITNGFSTGVGGGMYNSYLSSPTVKACTFQNNYASNGGGGMSNDYSSPTLIDCVFTDNTSENGWGEGGGMRNTNVSNPTLTGCTFTNNDADWFGGGMCNNGSCSPILINCAFLNNTAGSEGGGLYSYNNGSATLTNCTFEYNHALNGGGISTYASDPTLTNCIFRNNTADDGGGMYSSSWDINYSSPTLINCTFTNNNATDGGGGMVNSISAPTLTNCTFTGNTSEYGGGVYNYSSNSILEACTFENNTANSSGGGMFNYGSKYSTTLIDCTLKGNMTPTIGGAISCYTNHSLIVSDSVFTGNSSMSLDITTNFGGAIYNEGFADFTNCEFKDNSSGYGGAFHTTSTGETSLTNCAVKRNIGKVCGGASFNLLGSITSQNTMYCGNLPDHLVGGWVDDGGNELLDTCIPDEPAFCTGDMNQDYDVDVLDLLYLIAVWDTANPAGDINEDGWVDVADLLELISNWGACP